MPRSSMLLSAALMPLLVIPAIPQQLPEPSIRTPVDEVRIEQDRRTTELEGTIARALDETQDDVVRVEAVRSLVGIGFDYLLPNAPALIDGPTPVAIATVSALGATIAMLPSHSHHQNMEMNPYQSYQADQVAEIEKILRSALLSGAPEVQEEVAGILASRSDAPSLVLIQSLIDTGVFEQRAGIGYLTLAPSSLSSPIIASYIDSEDMAGRAAAVAQLSYNPDYTEQIREIALSSESDPAVVSGALDGLSRVDSQFLTYGLTLVQNEALPETVREQAFQATVRSTLINPVDPAIARALEPSLRDAVRDLAVPATRDALEQFMLNYDIQ